MPKWVYRVTGLPSSWPDEDAEENLRSLIRKHLEEDEDPSIVCRIRIVPDCTSSDGGRSALVTFEGIPRFLQHLTQKPSDDHLIEVTEDDFVSFDCHFCGFTQLYSTSRGEEITADIIAISGLGGHAYGSWRGKKSGRMWLGDFLQKSLPRCRTMLWGYDAKLDSQSSSLLSDYCSQFIEDIKSIRPTKEKRRPIFIVAHSFGGLIAARTLIQARNNDEDLYNAIYGFLFFGTPHKGLIRDDMRKRLGDPSHGRSKLLNQIDSQFNTDYLSDQVADFKNALCGREVVSFHEKHPTRSLQQDPATGRWEMSGPYITVANKETSLLQLGYASEKPVSVDADHSQMVKFESANDRTYKNAVGRLKQFEAVAQEQVLSRFESEVDLNKITGWLSKFDFRKVENALRNSQDRETGNAFLGSAEFALFERGAIPWLKCIGDEASGKTHLAFSVSECLRHEMRGRNRSVASLYLGRVDETPTTEDLLGAILRQMIESLEKPKVPNQVRDLYDDKASKQKTPTVRDLFELLRARIGAYDRVFLIVDGLYHLGGKLREVRRTFEDNIAWLQAQTMKKLSIIYFLWDDRDPPKARIFCDRCDEEADLYFRCEVCKGPEGSALDICPTCERGGQRCEDESHVLALLPKERFFMLPPVEDDLRAHVRRVIQEESERATSLPENSTIFGRKCARDPALRESLISEAVEVAGGKVSVARRWVECLKEQMTEDTFNRARALIPCSDELYEKELQELKDEREWRKKMGMRNDGLTILGLVAVAAVATRQLNARELQVALAALEANSAGETAQMRDHDVLQLTKGLLRIDRDRYARVRLEPDFQLYFTRSEIKASWLDAAHLDMANACLNYLNSDDFYTAYEKIKDDHAIDIPFLSYATSFWGIHVRETRAQAESKALKFLQDKNRTQAYIKAAWCANYEERGILWDVRRDVTRAHICAWFDLSSLLRKFCEEAESLVNDRELTYGQTPLMYACRRRQVDVVRVLLEAGADLNCFSTLGHTALFEAIIHREGGDPSLRLQIVDLLLGSERKLKLDTCDYRSKYKTALMVAAAQENSSEIVRKLLGHGANVNHAAKEGKTPLMVAVEYGRTENVKAILEASKVRVDLTHSRYRTSALHMAVERGSPDIVKLLLDHGANVMLCDIRGASALLKAVEKGDLSVVEAMLRPGLKSKIDLARRDRNGRGLLHGASKGGNVQIIHLLSRCGLRSHLPDDNGGTPLHEAAKYGRVDAATALISELLVDKSKRDRFGRTAFDIAVHYGHGDVARLLGSQAPASRVSKGDRNEGNPLHRAVLSSSVNQLEDLLKSNSVSPNEMDRNGRTPLHLAVDELNLEAAKLLVHYTDLSIKDRWGFTPMEVAVQRQMTDRATASKIALALIAAGAFFKHDDFDDISKLLRGAVSLGQAQAAKVLLDSGVDILRLGDSGGRKVLRLAEQSIREMRILCRKSWAYDPQTDLIPQPTDPWFFW